MVKKIILIVICLLLIGCTKKIKQDDNIKRLYLTDKYYNNGEFIDLKKDDITKLKNETYILFIYNNYCTLPIPCEDVFKEFMKNYKIDFLSMPFSEFKDTKYYEKIKYAPSIIVFNKENIVTYLDANSDIDLKKYQDVEEFTKWLDKYIYFTKK